MLKYAERYHSAMISIVDKVYSEQQEIIAEVADLFVKAIEDQRTIWAFGCTHGSMLAAEIYYRAGGLIPIKGIFGPGLWLDQLPVTRTSNLEKLEGYGSVILEDVPMNPGDIILVASTSGKNAVPIEVAFTAKASGLTVVGLTSLEYSRQMKSGHSSGKRLFEIADITLDNGAPYGDALVSYPEFSDFPNYVGATSTVSGTLILNAIVVEVVGRLLEAGVSPPVYLSGNLDKGMEENKRVMEGYRKPY